MRFLARRPAAGAAAQPPAAIFRLVDQLSKAHQRRRQVQLDDWRGDGLAGHGRCTISYGCRAAHDDRLADLEDLLGTAKLQDDYPILGAQARFGFGGDFIPVPLISDAERLLAKAGKRFDVALEPDAQNALAVAAIGFDGTRIEPDRDVIAALDLPGQRDLGAGRVDLLARTLDLEPPRCAAAGNALVDNRAGLQVAIAFPVDPGRIIDQRTRQLGIELLELGLCICIRCDGQGRGQQHCGRSKFRAAHYRAPLWICFLRTLTIPEIGCKISRSKLFKGKELPF